MRRVYAYLMKRRHIAKDVISHFARAGTLHEDAEHHNCVFVGTDENGVARHAHLRSANSYGKTFRINIESSDPRYSFHHIGTDGSLFVFEAPIDMLSYITMHPESWQERSYVACCGTSFIPVEKMIERIPETNTVYLCLDNDDGGQAACERMTEALKVWDMFYMARRKLKPYAADNKLPVTSWKQERSRLQQEIAATDARHAEIWQEVKELLNIQKCVEDVRHRQRTQNKERGIDR